MSDEYEKCLNCWIHFRTDIIVQYEDGSHWNYCPNCGQSWESKTVEYTKEVQ